MERFPAVDAPRFSQAEQTTARDRSRPSIAAIWRETLMSFSAFSAPVLASAFAGFALPIVVSAPLSVLFALDMYARTGAALTSYGPGHDIPLLVQAMIGLVAGTFTRGVITWWALRPARPSRASARDATGATLLCAPALLMVTLLAGGVIYAGNLGVTELLRELKLDMTDMSQLSAGFDGMARSILLRTLNELLPQPPPPFAEMLSYFRMETSRAATTLVYAGGFSFYRVKAFQELPLPWLVGGVSVLVLIAGDTLLRFTTASLMAAQGGRTAERLFNALALAQRRFWVVFIHIWLVRCALLAVSAVFMTIPLVLAQNILVPLLIRGTGSAWIYLVASMLLSISVALVNMVFAAFGVIYDARLYAALSDPPSYVMLTTR